MQLSQQRRTVAHHHLVKAKRIDLHTLIALVLLGPDARQGHTTGKKKKGDAHHG